MTNESTALTVETSTHALALIPTSIEGAMQLAKWLSAANFLPAIYQGKEANAFAMVLAGMELGLPPMAALRGLYPVNGKPSLETKTKSAICLKSRAAVYFKRTEYTEDATTWEMKRRDTGEIWTMRYTREEAQKAGLLAKAGPWTNYTKRMISHRALGWLCDDSCPDVMLGVGSAEDRFDVDAIDADFVEIKTSGANFQALPKNDDAPAAKIDPAPAAFAKARENAAELEKAHAAKPESAPAVADTATADLAKVAAAIETAPVAADLAPSVPADLVEISEEWVSELTRDLYACTKLEARAGLVELKTIAVKISKLKIKESDKANLNAAYKACKATIDAKLATPAGAAA